MNTNRAVALKRTVAGGVASAVCVSLVGLPTAVAGESVGSPLAYDAPMGSQPYSIACTDEGNPMMAGYGDGSIVKISWDGSMKSYPSGYPSSMPKAVEAAGKYMLMSLSDEGKIGRWNTETETWDAYWDMPLTYKPQQMAYDGEQYVYTILEGTRPKIAKTNVNSGASEYYDMPNGSEPKDIAPGPMGSGKMYVSDEDGPMRSMTYDGDYATEWTAPGGAQPSGMAKVGDKMLMAMPGNGKIAQRYENATVQKDVKTGSDPKYVSEGPSETAWYTTETGVGYLDSRGNYQNEWMMPGAQDLKEPTKCADGNMWVPDPEAGKIYRVRTGQKPVNYQEPWLTTEWAKVGEEVKVEDGTWKYKPTDYYHQWQYCAENTSMSCKDVPGATMKTWTPTEEYGDTYVQAKVWAKNLNGESTKLTTKRIQVRSLEVAPEPAPVVEPPTVVEQPVVQAVPYVKSVGNEQVAELSTSPVLKKGKKATFQVQFSTADLSGHVRMVYKPKKGKRFVIAKKVPVEDGIAKKRVKITKKFKKGGVVIATFVPSKRSDYTRAKLRLGASVKK